MRTPRPPKPPTPPDSLTAINSVIARLAAMDEWTDMAPLMRQLGRWAMTLEVLTTLGLTEVRRTRVGLRGGMRRSIRLTVAGWTVAKTNERERERLTSAAQAATVPVNV